MACVPVVFCLLVFFGGVCGQGTSARLTGAVEHGFGIIHSEIVFDTEVRAQIVQMLTVHVIQRTADKALQMKMHAASLMCAACILIASTFSCRHRETADDTGLRELVKCTVNGGSADSNSLGMECITQLVCRQMRMRMGLEILQNCRALPGAVAALLAHYS